LKEALEALAKILEILFKYLSPNMVLALIILIPVFLLIYKIYSDWVKRHEINETIKAKDETIQILNEHNRQLRVLELKLRGWSEADIDAVVMKQTPKNPIEARDMLERSKREHLQIASKKDKDIKKKTPKENS
jgi:SpoVK/Ycf46/Vps4 family AAA+-type ATPase